VSRADFLCILIRLERDEMSSMPDVVLMAHTLVLTAHRRPVKKYEIGRGPLLKNIKGNNQSVMSERLHMFRWQPWRRHRQPPQKSR
ncbi:hypothetical protein, partial [Aeromonas hydrophila]|uniref:hypothetical protein n=1 Tax=Aeromonas hydrophila TaxID=644 RepID=UPI001C8706A6